MFHRVVLAVIVLATVVPAPVATAIDPPPATTASDSDARILSALPDPTTPDDRGEFVVVRASEGTTLVLDDGEQQVSFVAPGGPIAVTSNPAATATLTDYPTVAPGLALANGGETVTLSVDGRVVDRLVYDRSREGERLERRDGPTGAWEWWPRTLPRRNVTTHGPAESTLFVLPDSPTVPVETLRGADGRILLAGYVVSSPRIADELVAAHERGVRVRVLVDDAPVGGFPRTSARVLDRLAMAGITVRVVGDPYSFHHAKYAVVDDEALVTTENWKPSGTGGRKSRGWGVVVHSPAVATDLATTFANDSNLPATQSWETYRTGRQFVVTDVANGSYPAHVVPTTIDVDRISVIHAPDNAEQAVVTRLDGADRRIDVIQPSVEADGPFVVALKRAAKRGVRVRLLLGSAWYVDDENRELADRLNRWADRTGHPLSVRLARPAGRYGAVHAKGVVADDTVIVGSLNWNRHSARENREVAVVLSDPAAATYYRDVFETDWTASRRGARPTLVGAAAVAILVALAALRRVEFEE
ncbi:phospholipase D-like domain-containing protein [Haloferax profundi]|uniref:Phospholipase n=1 Tax=Haloferax profundi TaxID=1544718 RepID=A0A0W1RU31_9EURY|nr:phospholipase D-like domain-containing protein [Haloferax profundi]KTG17173.1 phospholipase [Haloferax profundi]